MGVGQSIIPVEVYANMMTDDRISGGAGAVDLAGRRQRYRAAAKALQQLERQMNDLQKARAEEAKSVFRAEQNKTIAEARKKSGRN